MCATFHYTCANLKCQYNFICGNLAAPHSRINHTTRRGLDANALKGYLSELFPFPSSSFQKQYDIITILKTQILRSFVQVSETNLYTSAPLTTLNKHFFFSTFNASQLAGLTCFALSAVSRASSAVDWACSVRSCASPRLALASSDLLFAELISRSISVIFASARSASALDLSMTSLNFWKQR